MACPARRGRAIIGRNDGNDVVTTKTSSRFSSLTGMFSPNSVAVLGASSEPARIGGRPIDLMRKQGFAGAIYPVNPRRDEVQGLRCYPSVADLPAVPDVAIVAVAAEIAVDAVADLAARGVKNVVMLSAGFAEVDEAGAAAQARMVGIARAAGMRLLGPNCLGLFNARLAFYATFSAAFDSGWPIPGRIGIASQSGAYGSHVFAAMRDRGIGTPLMVTTGNEGDVTIGDIIGWMAEDPDTDVIAAYAEGIRESDSFLAALAAAKAAKKPIVMMKVGRSALGTAAAQSHTASIAGDDAVTDAVLREFGVVRARTTEEMIDIALTATRKIYPAGNTLGVLTVSGGAGVLISDAAEALGLPMPEMPQDAQDRLRAIIPFCAPRNPVDCTAQITNQPQSLGTFADALVVDGGYKSVLAFWSQAGATEANVGRLTTSVAPLIAQHPDRLFMLSVLAPRATQQRYEAAGFLVMEDPSRAVTALHAMGRFGDAFAAGPKAAPPVVPAFTLPATTPSEADAKTLLAAAGIPAAPERACATVEHAVAAAQEIGFPVVLKILSPDIVHKSEIGGVLLDIADADAVRAGFATLMQRGATVAGARLDGVLVAKQLKGGVECILGIHRDPVFGPIAMFGLGGIFVEVLKDVVFHRAPFGEDVAEAMIRSIKAAPLLTGVRGRKPADIKALARMLARLSVFAHQAGDRLAGIDLNPVLAMPEGEGAFAVDAVIEIVKN